MKRDLICALLAGGFLAGCSAEPPPQAAPPRSADSAEAAVQKVYQLVTFGPGEEPDWNQVREMFVEQAVVVLRTSQDSQTVFDLEGFVQDFVRFIENSEAKTAGFVERIVRMRSLEFGAIAHVLVLYEANIPGSERGPRPGVDSFQLIRSQGRWRIVSVINELPGPDLPIPEVLQE